MDALLPAPCPERVALSVFPSVSPLSSSGSAPARVRAAAPRGVVRRSRRYYGPVRLPTHLGLTASAFPERSAPDQGAGERWALPVLAHGASVHAMVLRPRGVRGRLALAPSAGVAFRLFPRRRHPVGRIFRGSIARPARTPTDASPSPRGYRRTARGHRGSLALRCRTPSFLTPCRFIPAHVAVGTALAGGPPHRSQRAELPHWAPTLGVERQIARLGKGVALGAAVATCRSGVASAPRSSACVGYVA